MLLVDDLLAAPMHGLLWIFEEVRNAASEAQHARRDEIMAALSALYLELEQGRIDEDAFEAREQELLDELDALDARFSDQDDEVEEDPDEEDAQDELEAPARAASGSQPRELAS